MRQSAAVSFLAGFLLIITATFAQVEVYRINTVVDDKGMASVILSVKFSLPVKTFEFFIFGEIQSFDAISDAGPVDCKTEVGEATSVECSLNITSKERTLRMSFETNDFVKQLKDNFYFSADFGLGQPVSEVRASVKLPVGMVLVGEEEKAVSPWNATVSTDGRNIIVEWRLTDVSLGQPLRFNIMYEGTQPQPLFSIRLRYFIVLGAVAVCIILFLLYMNKRAPRKLILSVLDEYERSVMNVIVLNDGVVNQKKVVRETNLSKAKVSRVVKSLMERGLIEVERMGRTNKLKLVGKKFKFF